MTTLPALANAALAALFLSSTAYAASNQVSISVNGNQRCFQTNGIPDHSHGSFPNSGNPHTMREQSDRLCVPLNPRKGNRANPSHGAMGVALNGIQIRPGTADWYDGSSRRGHSRDRSSGWNMEGIGSRDKLGIDHNNAHVDNRGLYHYHGVAPDLVKSQSSSLIAYAADGFEIHYRPGTQTSSWRLKQGNRPTEPYGRYDGQYNQDYEYVEGSGSLDRCNGGMLEGRFVYFATDRYPFFSRCLWGEISSDFGHGGGGMQGGGPGNGPEGSRGSNRRGPSGGGQQRGSGRRGPPPQALEACEGLSSGDSCSFHSRRSGRTVSGSCFQTPDNQLACRPKHRR